MSSHLLHAESVNESFEGVAAFNGQLVKIPEISSAPEARNESGSCNWSRTLDLFATFLVIKFKFIDYKQV